MSSSSEHRSDIVTALASSEWKQFDEIDLKHTNSDLLAQVVAYARNLGADYLPTDTYAVPELCKALEQLKESKTRDLLASLDHLRFYSGAGPMPKKLPSFRIKPSINHIAIEDPVVNKQYTVRLTLTNKSPVPAKWQVVNPHQDRQSVFFSAHPYRGTIEAGKHGGLSLELVLLDARDFHRLIIIETQYEEHQRTYSAILMASATASYPEGAVLSEGEDLGDVDLEACYWSVKPTDLKLVSKAKLLESNGSLSSSSSKELGSSSGSSQLKKTSRVSPPPIDVIAPAVPPNPFELARQQHEAIFSPSSELLPEGTQYQIFGIPVHVKKFSLCDESARAEFWYEVNMMSSLRHPHLVNLIGASAFADDGQLITRVFRRGDLRSFLKCQDPDLKPYKALSFKISMLHGLAQALHFVHSFDRIHRSISASNVFITEDFFVKLSAPSLRLYSSVTARRIITGDEAPEVAISQQWSEAADVFSLGLVMWELLAEKRPERTEEQIKAGFVPTFPTEMLDKMKKVAETETEELLAIMNSCLSVKPSERINSKMLSRKLAKLATAVPAKPGHVHRRKTRERGLGGRILQQSNDQIAIKSHVDSLNGTRGSSEVIEIPKASSNKKLNSSSGPTKRKVPRIPKQPPSPEVIHVQTPPQSPHIEAAHHNPVIEVETEPRRITADFVEASRPSKSTSHKKKKSKDSKREVLSDALGI